MKIPNKLLELSRNELMVACRLYSIVNRHTKLTTNGYAVCIKQETIAASCGLSVATVKRVLKALSEKGLITHQYRQTRSNGCLGATHYDLQAFSFLSDYFYMANAAITNRKPTIPSAKIKSPNFFIINNLLINIIVFRYIIALRCFYAFGKFKKPTICTFKFFIGYAFLAVAWCNNK